MYYMDHSAAVCAPARAQSHESTCCARTIGGELAEVHRSAALRASHRWAFQFQFQFVTLPVPVPVHFITLNQLGSEASKLQQISEAN